jgi:uncharacterized protein (TIGR03492 family)
VWRHRQLCDWVVVVGDVLPVLAAWLTAKPMAIYLVAYSSHYEGRLRLPWPCGWLLRCSRVRLLWSRDALTAKDLARQLRRPVDFVGNPFQEMEGDAIGLPPLSKGEPVLGLLPGSRCPEALANLLLMLEVLTRLPPQWQGRLRILAALVSSLTPEAIAAAASLHGWRLELPAAETGHSAQLRRGALRLELIANQFWWVLRASPCCSWWGRDPSSRLVLPRPSAACWGRR